MIDVTDFAEQAAAWLAATALGFGSYGLTVVAIGLALALSGPVAQAWRTRTDRRRTGEPGPRRTIYLKLSGTMFALVGVLGLGYAVALHNLQGADPAVVTVLLDLAVIGCLIALAAGLVLPGALAHAAVLQVSGASDRNVEALAALVRR